MKPEEQRINEVHGIEEGQIVAVFIKTHNCQLGRMRKKAIRYMKKNYGKDVEIVECEKECWRTIPHSVGSRYVQGSGRGSFQVTVASFEKWSR